MLSWACAPKVAAPGQLLAHTATRTYAQTIPPITLNSSPKGTVFVESGHEPLVAFGGQARVLPARALPPMAAFDRTAGSFAAQLCGKPVGPLGACQTPGLLCTGDTVEPEMHDDTLQLHKRSCTKWVVVTRFCGAGLGGLLSTLTRLWWDADYRFQDVRGPVA